MSLIGFDEIKKHPGFSGYYEYKDKHIKKCEEQIIEQGISTGDQIMELVKKYGYFHIDRYEAVSGDRLRFFFMPFSNPCPYWDEFGQKAVFIGTIVNSDCGNFKDKNTIESAYLLDDGCYYNQSKKKIADSIEELFDYFMRVEYDHHAPISPKTYERLKSGGWYEGRKVDISGLIAECEENGITLTDCQKAFLEEFSGVCCADYSGDVLKMERLFIFNEEINQFSEYTYIDDFDKKWIYDHYDKSAVCVGKCYDCEGVIWLTGDGQLLLQNISTILYDENWVAPIGRTIMNGFNVILG
ncbi:SUKH-3 immunity protein [Ruminococcus sp. YE71]|uniref:SUKH-3 domain-containing protein n=1 Tax=unclassified Ruminococcus TaxID=2608920 RepID=UPI00087FD1A7|nr:MULTISPECIES: SUKH-3 domain-containing protein [unclassified Ruminococcus]SDA31264.1 SUKH-3 immunity protein [Ruminococcus sp. YE78]SFW51243.1 SUKH-3 immunity protein [Ruminococcus sp. YE71]